MFGSKQRIEIDTDQLAEIENALHTQSKILGVQASAGGRQARERLDIVKRALSTIARQKPAAETAAGCSLRSAFFRQTSPAE
ncbi:MAG: hypothetical protein P1U53_13910 [Sulfitobacter sp.]|nr:hypothetical protein [Sulfitobacter sp.]